MRQLMIGLCILLLSNAHASPTFDILPLGVYGGLKDGNLSAYLIKATESENYVSLDAGTLVHGLEVAANNQSVSKYVNDLLQNHIPAYLISHAHLDHIVGLLMAQPELREQQKIMAREETMQALQKHIFNWAVWGNFGDGGELPHLNFQHYQTLPLLQWVDIPDTELEVKTYPLSHSKMAASAFLIRHKKNYVLYFGDTGADSIEKATRMHDVWKEVAPLIASKQLRAIMLECSFVNAQPDDKLFGHLKPTLFMQELHKLAATVNPLDFKNALRGFPVIVTHIKPKMTDFAGFKEDVGTQILEELSEKNDIGVQLIRPEQGIRISL